MRKIAGLAAALLLALLSFNAAAAPDRGTEAEAQGLVKKAIQYYDKVGRKEAMAEFQHAMEVAPDDQFLARGMGWSLKDHGRYEEAHSHWLQALSGGRY